MQKLFIPIIQGTNRRARQSIMVSKLIKDTMEKDEEIETQIIDPREFKFNYDGNSDQNKNPEYSKITKDADAFFIVVPEYNHSFPGSLKTLLDTELKNYIHKPVAFAGVSAGPWGGVRAIESLVNTVREMGMVITFADVQFPKVQEIFDENNELKDEKYIERIEKSLEELKWMTKTMKWGIKNLESKYHS